jgi:phage terminase large subunit-like protein
VKTKTLSKLTGRPRGRPRKITLADLQPLPPEKPPIPDPTSQWARDVGAGKIVAGPHVRNACLRHLRDLEEGGKRGLYFDREAAKWAIEFFPSCLRLAGGQFEGRTFDLHPSQQFIVGSIFGWKRIADDTRRFRRAYIEQAKGSGKSPLLAGIGHFCLIADGEARAEVYAAAANTAQAMVLFRDAVAMREQSPGLTARLTTSGGNPVWNLSDLGTGSFFRPISSEARRSGSGPRPSCALLDEVHEHPDGLTIEMLERGFKWRRQPILIMATNSGTDRNSACWQEHEYAVQVAAGTRTPDAAATFVGEVLEGSDAEFSFVCGLDPGDDPLTDPSCWIKANPLIGVTMTEDLLGAAVAQARAIPGKLNGILRLNFCVWTDAETAWMSRQMLEEVLADFDPADHYGEPLFLGADLSATRDMTALAFLVPTGMVEVERPDGTVLQPKFDLWCEAWTPADTLQERSLQDHAPYDVWVKQGYLNACPGKLVRMDIVAARVAEAQTEYSLEAVAYDSYAFRKNFEPELDMLGVTTQLIEHPQGGKRRAPETELWMPGSLKELEALILERRIRIRNTPLTISAFMSAATESDAFDNRWFSKRHATNRIDPLVAAAMAVGAALWGRNFNPIDVEALIG